MMQIEESARERVELVSISTSVATLATHSSVCLLARATTNHAPK